MAQQVGEVATVVEPVAAMLGALAMALLVDLHADQKCPVCHSADCWLPAGHHNLLHVAPAGRDFRIFRVGRQQLQPMKW